MGAEKSTVTTTKLYLPLHKILPIRNEEIHFIFSNLSSNLYNLHYINLFMNQNKSWQRNRDSHHGRDIRVSVIK